MPKKEVSQKNKYIKQSRRNTLFKTVVTILFWGFVISTTIVLLLFSDGYSVSLDERKITQNGAIAIESSPEGAEVFLNGKKRGETPLTLPSVKPGYHDLDIVKDGFTTWSSQIYLQKRRAVEVNATLFRNTSELSQLSVKNIKEIFPVAKDDKMFFSVDNGDGSISLFSRPYHFFFWDLNKEETLLTTINTDKFSIQPSPRGSFVLIKSSANLLTIPPTEASTDKNFYYLLRNEKEAELTDLTSLNALENVIRVSWPLNSDTKLLVETPTQLFSYDTQTNQTILLLTYSKDIKPVYTTTNLNNVIYVDPITKEPMSTSLEGTNRRKLLTEGSATLVIESPSAILAEQDENFFIVQDETKFTYFNNSTLLNTKQTVKEILLETNASKIDLGKVSPDRKWLFYRDEERNLAAYNLEDLDKIFETGIERNFVMLKATLIEDGQQFMWHPNSKHILSIAIREEGPAAVKSLNVSNQNIHTLYKGELVSKKFGLSRDGDKLVFLLLENEEQRLYELDLLDNQVIKIGLLQ